jgi:hypothetical protein
MFISFLLLIYCIVIVYSTDNIYPTCGDCYCIPDNNGLGDCPNWVPKTIFSNEVITSYQYQIPTSIYTIDCNPYKNETCKTKPLQTNLDIDTAVCAFSYKNSGELNNSCSEYDMITYSTHELAIASNDIVTHAGSCGKNNIYIFIIIIIELTIYNFIILLFNNKVYVLHLKIYLYICFKILLMQVKNVQL